MANRGADHSSRPRICRRRIDHHGVGAEGGGVAKQGTKILGVAHPLDDKNPLRSTGERAEIERSSSLPDRDHPTMKVEADDLLDRLGRRHQYLRCHPTNGGEHLVQTVLSLFSDQDRPEVTTSGQCSFQHQPSFRHEDPR